jgi:hypothetical protein
VTFVKQLADVSTQQTSMADLTFLLSQFVAAPMGSMTANVKASDG